MLYSGWFDWYYIEGGRVINSKKECSEFDYGSDRLLRQPISVHRVQRHRNNVPDHLLGVEDVWYLQIRYNIQR